MELEWPSWAIEPRWPVLVSDQSPAAEFILAMLRHESVEFVYWGGSTPGATRRAIPLRMFTIGESAVVYAQSWCLTRKADRVFRMDNVELPGCAADFVI